MVRELPDFVTGLVNIAQRGRSLGIHLILATQRPVRRGVAGDPGQHQPADRAARHRRRREHRRHRRPRRRAASPRCTPGRAYARLGHSSLAAFQTGRVGGRRPGAVGRTAAAPVAGRGRLGARSDAPAPSGRRRRGRPTPRSPTCRCWSRRSGRGRRDSACRAQHSPWLPGAARQLAARRAAGAAGQPGRRPGRRLAVGPVRRRGPARRAGPGARCCSTSRTFGHLIVAGAPRSRPVAGAAHDRRQLARLTSSPPTCTSTARLRQRRAAAAGRPAALRRGRAAHPDRPRRPGCSPCCSARSPAGRSCWPSTATPTWPSSGPPRRPRSACRYLVFLLDRWEGFMASLRRARRRPAHPERAADPARGRRASGCTRCSPATGRRCSAGCRRTIEDKLVLRMGDRNDYGLAGLQTEEDARRRCRPGGRSATTRAGDPVRPARPRPVRAGAGQGAAPRIAAAAQRAGRVRAARPAAVPGRRAAGPDLASRRPGSCRRRRGRRRRCGRWSASAATSWRRMGVDLDDDGPGFVIGGPARSGPVDRAADHGRVPAGGRQRAGRR